MAESTEPVAEGGVPPPSESASPRAVAPMAENKVAAAKSGAEGESRARGNLQPHDFRHPAFLSPGELRRLRLQHEDFIRALAARLSIYLRLEFSLQLSKLHTLSYAKFTQAMVNPTHLSLFKVEPLRGIGIFEMPPRLGLAIVDRLLGGSVPSAAPEHSFSEIEVALLDQAVQLILSEWCQQWSKAQVLHAVPLGHETNGQFLHTASHDNMLLVLVVEAKLGDCVEPMQIALPCSTLEPLIRKLGDTSGMETQKARPPVPLPKWNRNFDEVPVPVAAIWDDLVLTAREVACLKAGDVLPLDPKCTRQVKLRLASQSRFEGNLGTVGGKWAVSLTETIKTEVSP